jgi:hypothetical protein
MVGFLPAEPLPQAWTITGRRDRVGMEIQRPGLVVEQVPQEWPTFPFKERGLDAWALWRDRRGRGRRGFGNRRQRAFLSTDRLEPGQGDCAFGFDPRE